MSLAFFPSGSRQELPGGGNSRAVPASAPVIPVTLLHPAVADTAKLSTPAQTVALFGILGLEGQAAAELHGAIVKDGDQVTCQQQPTRDYACLLDDGTDVAALALRKRRRADTQRFARA